MAESHARLAADRHTVNRSAIRIAIAEQNDDRDLVSAWEFTVTRRLPLSQAVAHPSVKTKPVTAGPANTAGALYMPLSIGTRAVGKATSDEIRQIVHAVPHEELSIQLDLAVEVESEEMLRRLDPRPALASRVALNGVLAGDMPRVSPVGPGSPSRNSAAADHRSEPR